MDNTHIIGIDIAKLKFDVALMINGKVKDKTFKNTPEGRRGMQDISVAYSGDRVPG
jgi:transposase